MPSKCCTVACAQLKVLLYCVSLLYWMHDLDLGRVPCLRYLCSEHGKLWGNLFLHAETACSIEAWRVVDFFAGGANLTTSMKQLNFRALKLDVLYGGKHMDLLTPYGMACLGFVFGFHMCAARYVVVV